MRFRLGFAVLMCVLLAGCSSVGKDEPLMVPPYEKEVRGDNVADVTLTAMYVKGKVDNGMFEEPTYYDGIKALLLTIENDTDKELLIDWSKSSISYNGTTSLISSLGQNLKRSYTAAAKTPVKVGKMISRTIFPSEMVVYNPGESGSDGDNQSHWEIQIIPSDKADVSLCITSGESETMYDFRFKL